MALIDVCIYVIGINILNVEEWMKTTHAGINDTRSKCNTSKAWFFFGKCPEMTRCETGFILVDGHIDGTCSDYS